MESSKDILDALAKRGYRVTTARREIVKALKKSPRALTIQALAEKVSADEASVYRTIKVLVDEHLVEEIVTVGVRPQYALEHGHHHHIVCATCGTVNHVPCTGMVSIPPLPRNFSQIHSHEVTYYGVCKVCS